MTDTTTHIVFPIFDRMTHLDFTGPHQVFSDVPEARITVASMGGRDIEARGFVFSGLADLSKVESCDVLCVPGGSGTTEAMVDEAFMGEIRRLAGGAKYLTSVCTGAFILGRPGCCAASAPRPIGPRAISWRRWVRSVDEGRVVRDGNVITGGGVTAGIDFALVAVAEIFGRDVAESIELRMEYAPAPPFGVGRPDIAPAELVTSARDSLKSTVDANRGAVEQVVHKLKAP